MKRYLTLRQKDDVGYYIVYCNNHTDKPETDEEIMRAVTTHVYEGKFNASEYTCVLGEKIKDDEHMYVLTYTNGEREIWQVCDLLRDMTEAVVPNTYLIRKVGYVLGGE